MPVSTNPGQIAVARTPSARERWTGNKMGDVRIGTAPAGARSVQLWFKKRQTRFVSYAGERYAESQA